MADFNDLFNPKGGVAPKQNANFNEFKPDAKKTQNGVYTAIVRFVPYFAQPNQCEVSKMQAWVENPLTKVGMYVDDPRSGGSQDSPVNSMYWNLINTKNGNLMDLAKKCLSTKLSYASLVQVIQDNQNPKNVGKILVWKYGKKIHEKLDNEQNPPMENMVAYNPFDPINGRYFSVKVVLQSGFNNVDACQFIDYKGPNGETSGVWMYNSVTQKVEIVNENTDKQMFYDYLAQNSPDLSKYAFQPWTTQVQEHVDSVLKLIGTYVTTGSFGQNIAAATAPASPTVPATPSFSAPTVNFGGMPNGNTFAAVPTPAPTITPTAPAMPATPTITPSINMASPVETSVPSTPSISGIELPEVASLPTIEPVADSAAPMFGDLNSVLANM